MTASPTQVGFRETLRIRPVRRLWIAQLVSILGDYMALFAVLSLVTFQLHGDAFAVSMVWVVFLLPLAVISPVAGVYVDKWNVKATMITSDLLRAALVAVLLFEHNLIAIYATIFLMSSISSFFLPAQTVTIRAITPPEALVAANGLMSQAQQLSQIVAPAIMGLVIEKFGVNVCFGFDFLSFLVSASLVATLAIYRKPAAGGSAAGVLHSLQEGLKFIFTHGALSFVILSMTAGMFAVRCFGALLSIYVRDILRGDPGMYGNLNSLIGVGMIGGAQLLPRLTHRTTRQHLVAYGLAGMGVAVFVSSAWARVAPATAAMIALGFFAAFVMICATVLIQEVTPHELLGRVTSTLMSLLAMAQVTALFAVGPAAARLGIIPIFYFSAAALVLIGVIGYWKLKGAKPAAEQASA
jgi:MFS family permease